ncbi:MAG: hypothetical protein SV422_14415, partial [Pseudomonadota bacterium]|nr:hypothetical protein [Pseudomonadota bacterium]
MSPAELLSRSMQEACKTLDRLTLNTAGAEAPCLFRKLKDDEMHTGIIRQFRSGHGDSAERQMARQFQATAPARFFPGAGENAVIDAINEVCPSEQAGIIKSADAICRG